MSKTLVISITIPDGVEVDIQRGSNVVPQAQAIFADDLEELGPIPSPPPEEQIGFVAQAPMVRGIAVQQYAEQEAARASYPGPVMPNGGQFPPFGTRATHCPVHNLPWKSVPAGVSKKNGKPYSAFRACPVDDCRERP